LNCASPTHNSRPDPRAVRIEGRGVRIGISYVASVGKDEAEALVAEREANGPFAGVADLARRTQLSRDGLEALVKGGACDGFGRRRRDLLWELGLVSRARSVPGTGGESQQLPLSLDPTTETPALRDLTRWERMLADYRHTGLSVGTHPLTLLRPHLPSGTLSSADLLETPHARQVAVAGMTVACQRPSTAMGIVFMLLEDEHGQINLIVPSLVYVQHRATVRAELLVAPALRADQRTATSSSPGSVAQCTRAPCGRGRHGMGVAPPAALLRPSLSLTGDRLPSNLFA
jgi:error-prone DNA polymerase